MLFFPWDTDIFSFRNFGHLKIHVFFQIEESILQSLAWKNESPLWDAMKEQSGSIPTCEEVFFSSFVNCDTCKRVVPLGFLWLGKKHIMHLCIKKHRGKYIGTQCLWQNMLKVNMYNCF